MSHHVPLHAVEVLPPDHPALAPGLVAMRTLAALSFTMTPPPHRTRAAQEAMLRREAARLRDRARRPSWRR